MPDKQFTCDQIIHQINQTTADIWENDCLEHDINIKTLKYIMNKLKQIFIEIKHIEPDKNNEL